MQISTTPVWLRHTAENKKSEDLKKIVLWENRPKPEKKLQEAAKIEIEKELKQIENNWEKKLRIRDSSDKKTLVEDEVEEGQIEETNGNEAICSELREKAKNLRSKFCQSMSIHQQPNELSFLCEIFEFRSYSDVEANTNTNTKKTFRVDTSKSNQLLFIEYICRRLRELLTTRTKEYLAETESSEKLTLNEEREREELIEKANNYVFKSNSLFSQIGNESSHTQGV